MSFSSLSILGTSFRLPHMLSTYFGPAMRSDFYNHGIDDLMKLQTHRILDELKGKCDNLVIDIADIVVIVEVLKLLILTVFGVK